MSMTKEQIKKALEDGYVSDIMCEDCIANAPMIGKRCCVKNKERVVSCYPDYPFRPRVRRIFEKELASLEAIEKEHGK